ncbi:MAG: hypothetical protein WCQ32_00840 [bacterium]
MEESLFLQDMGTVSLGACRTFITKDFFTECNEDYIERFIFCRAFKKKIIPVASTTIKAKAILLKRRKLIGPAYDSIILAKFSDPPVLSVDSFLAYLKKLISNQPKIKEGNLLTNGYPNIFFVQLDGRIVIVDAVWSTSLLIWSLRCFEIDEFSENLKGAFVFFPITTKT